MSRLAKVQEQKQKKKQQSKILVTVLGLILVFGVASLLYGNLVGDSEEADLIDLDRTTAYIDFFDITYVHVYLKEELSPSKVLVNEELLEKDPARGRWTSSFLGYSQGEELTVKIIADNNGDSIQEEILIIEEISNQ